MLKTNRMTWNEYIEYTKHRHLYTIYYCHRCMKFHEIWLTKPYDQVHGNINTECTCGDEMVEVKFDWKEVIAMPRGRPKKVADSKVEPKAKVQKEVSFAAKAFSKSCKSFAQVAHKLTDDLLKLQDALSKMN